METGAKTVRCSFCGHENPAGHRFCGMCARALPGTPAAKPAPTTPAGTKPEAPPPQAVTPAPAPASPPKEAIRPVPPPAQASAPVPRPPAPQVPAPPTPPPAVAPPARRSQPSKDLTYLLEDEHDQPTSRVWIGVVLVFLVLFGFFLWQMGGLDAFLKWYQGGKPQVAETQPSDGAAGTTPAPAASPTPESQTPSAPAESPKPPETTPPKEASKEEPKQESAPESKKTEETPTPAPPEPKPEVKKAPPPPKPRPQPVVAKPAKPAPAAPDPATECDRRLAFLRGGDSRGESGATAQLGTMYYEGRCVARDLPTAYRLYARALHKDPNNSQIADTIANIWKQMSPAERQLAIKPQ